MPRGAASRTPSIALSYAARSFIATALFAAFHPSVPIALYIVVCSVIGISSTALLTDYTNRDISAEYEAV